MNNKTVLFAGSLVAVWVVSSCGAPPPTPEAVDKWRGATPHLRVEGQLKGEKISINLTGAAAADAMQLRCRREYFADKDDAGVLNLATAVPSEVKIIWKFTTDAGIDSAELEIKRHDFRANAAGDTATAIIRNDLVQPAVSDFWFEYQKNDPDSGVKTLEYGAQSGTYTHGAYDCARDPAKPALCTSSMPGTQGGFFTGVWSETDKLSASWTANCNEDKVEARP